MAVIGIDLGVRSVHIARLSPTGHLSLYPYICPTPKVVASQPEGDRAKELDALARAVRSVVNVGDLVLVEEPPAAGSKNLRTYLKLAQVSGVAAASATSGGASTVFVPVDTWKKGVIGRGGVSKDDVARWLELTYPGYYTQCNTDQNLIDATCIALSRAPAPRSLDQPHIRLAAG